jgi:hypothetical protein
VKYVVSNVNVSVVQPDLSIEVLREQALILDDRTIRGWYKCEFSGKIAEKYGRLCVNQHAANQHLLSAVWDDGIREGLFVYNQVPFCVLPVGCDPGCVLVPTVASAYKWQAEKLPDHWDLSRKVECLGALKAIVPGKWLEAAVTRMCNTVPGTQKYTVAASMWDRPLLAPACVQILSKVLQLNAWGNIVDPMSGRGGVAVALRKLRLPVLANEFQANIEAEMHEDPCQPGFFRKLKSSGRLGAVVMAPLPRIVDILFPLACIFAEHAVCCHVPSTYITAPVTARLAWLKALHREGRLLHIVGLPSQPSTMESPGLWLCVFKSRECRDAAVQPAYELRDSMLYVAG